MYNFEPVRELKYFEPNYERQVTKVRVRGGRGRERERVLSLLATNTCSYATTMNEREEVDTFEWTNTC